MLLADDLFVEMAGVFEYDAELKEKGEHRKFLTQTASFKQVTRENGRSRRENGRIFSTKS